MLLRDESDTALPQKDRFSFRSWGQPRARTSVAVSERAQQNDCSWSISQSMQSLCNNNYREHSPSQDLEALWLRSLDKRWRCPLDRCSRPSRA